MHTFLILLCKHSKSYFEWRNMANSRLFFKKRSGQMLWVRLLCSAGKTLRSLHCLGAVLCTREIRSLSQAPAGCAPLLSLRLGLQKAWFYREAFTEGGSWFSEGFPQTTRKWPGCRLFTITLLPKPGEHRIISSSSLWCWRWIPPFLLLGRKVQHRHFKVLIQAKNVKKKKKKTASQSIKSHICSPSHC